MGRWVTSKGRRIYIPDEGEENPFKEGFKKKKEIQDIADKHNKKVWNGGARNKELYDEADKFAESHNFNKEKTRDAAFAAFNEKWVDSVKRKQEGKDPIDKEESTKQKQIAQNKAQADERNGKKEKPIPHANLDKYSTTDSPYSKESIKAIKNAKPNKIAVIQRESGTNQLAFYFNPKSDYKKSVATVKKWAETNNVPIAKDKNGRPKMDGTMSKSLGHLYIAMLVDKKELTKRRRK